MKSLLIFMSVLLIQVSAFANSSDEIKSRAIRQVLFQTQDRNTEIGRAHLKISEADMSGGPYVIVKHRLEEFGTVNAMILSQMGSRTDTISTVLVRVPYADDGVSTAMWSRRSITVLVKVNSVYEDETDLISYQIQLVPDSVNVNIE